MLSHFLLERIQCVNCELRSQIATVDKPQFPQSSSLTAAVTGGTGAVTGN